MNSVIHMLMALIFVVALTGAAGWIVPVLIVAVLSAASFVISELRHR